MLHLTLITIVAKREGIVDKIDGKRIVIKATEETDFVNLVLIFIIYKNLKDQTKILV